MNRYIFFYFCCIVLFASGCVQQKIIDDLALINGLAYDISKKDDEQLEITATFPIITKKGQYDRKTLSVTAKSSKSAREKLKYETNLQLVSGQVRVALFGTELAERGLLPILDTFVRDPSIGARVNLALGKGTASDIINVPIENEGQNATFLEQFITKLHKENERADYNLFQFMRDYYDDGIDPILPVFKAEKTNIKYEGIGLFMEDKLIDFLNPQDSHMLFFLRDEIIRGDLDFEIELQEGKKDTIMLSYVQTDHHIKVLSNQPNEMNVIIEIAVLGDVVEFTGDADLSDPKLQKKLEKMLAKKIDEKSKKLIVKIQELKVDPIGLGRHIRNSMKYKDWKKIDWQQVYKDMNIEVKTTVQFSNTGKWK
jgi:spore germination protein